MTDSLSRIADDADTVARLADEAFNHDDYAAGLLHLRALAETVAELARLLEKERAS